MAIAGLLIGSLFIAAAPDSPRPVTFNEDIAPIVIERCAGCHRPGGAAPFALLTYDDVRRRAKQIASVTKSRYMPPWKPEPGYGDFAGERRLSDREIGVIREWVEQGAAEGEMKAHRSTPLWPSDWQIGKPDLVLTMPEAYLLPGDGPDVFRSFVISIPVSAGRYVKGLEFHPGSTKAVHHANVKIDRTRNSRRRDEEEPGPGFEGGGGRDARFPDGHFLGWTPGQLPHLSQDTAWRAEPGSDLVVEMHMTPTGKPERVKPTIGLVFTDEAPSRVPYMVRLGKQSIDIPAGSKAYTTTDSYVLPVDVDVLSVQPHAHYLARQIIGSAKLPDGSTKPLISIKDWDFRWQDVYRYREALSLPRGTTLVMEYTYDNSAANPRNPNHPPRRVTFGQTTSSEMGDLWLQVMTRNGADRATLDRDYAPKMLQEDIAGDEKTLELNPQDARLHSDLAFCYLEAGRMGDAVAHFREAVRLEPTSPNAHYDLGTTLLNDKRLDEAEAHFTAALRLKPDFSEGHNNLGVVRFLKGKVDEAIGSYAESLRVNPGNAEAQFNLAGALAAQASRLTTEGRIEEAISRYRRALELDPDLPAALADLAWILATSERPEIRAPLVAVQLAERAAQVTKHADALVLDTLATAYFAAGRVSQAISTAQAAFDLATSSGAGELANRIHERLAFYQRQRQ